MTETFKKLLKQALALDEKERLLLTRALLENSLIETEERESIPDWHRRILDERLRDMKEKPDDWIPWEDFRAELIDKSSDVA